MPPTRVAHQLHQRNPPARSLGASRYRLYSIGDGHPGMFEVVDGGVAVEGEVYRLADNVLRRVEAGEPPGLYRGPVQLSDGRMVQGILFPRAVAESMHQD